MGDPQYVVALYTFGSFHGFASDPSSLDEARAFVASPPAAWYPRQQDTLVILEVTPFMDEEG
jgi:hypothetical protein